MLNGSSAENALAQNDLLVTLSQSSHAFLQPSPSLHAHALALAKQYLDPLASAVSHDQECRLHAARKKRKRGEPDPYDPRKVLRLKELHLDGFHIDQVWAQAKRALDASKSEIETSLKEAEGGRRNGKLQKGLPNSKVHGASVDSVGSEASSNEENINLPNQEESGIEAMEVGEEEDVGIGGAGSSQDSGADSVSNEEDGNADEMDDVEHDLDLDDESKEVFVPDKNGLNDGFFSIDEFNRQSDFLERQDARGEDDGAASDEEEVDWSADPSTIPLAQTDEVDGIEGDEDFGDEEDGPTFGNADLHGPDLSGSEEGSDDEMLIDGMDSTSNTNTIKYADFFAPPPRKATKADRRRALPKTQPPQKETDDDVERAISVVRRDIFEDDLTPSEDNKSDNDADSPKRSSHQKRQAALTAEIRRLESAALTKRDWRLNGEARASDRPLNSLLEEDLEFERVGKPVPVITQEVSEDIESLIKRRILAREFDEVIRRRPGSLGTGQQQQTQRRGLLDGPSTSKPSQSLSQLYEDEHLRRRDPSAHPTREDKKQQAEHAAVISLWKEVSAQLDALTSWHFRPKPPETDISVVADVPAVQMEDARPAGAEGVGTAGSRLAPQEIYRPGDLDRDRIRTRNGDGNDEGEDEGGATTHAVVRTKGGQAVSREEMTREDKRRRRRREKERIKKKEVGTTQAPTPTADGNGNGNGKGGKRDRGRGRGDQTAAGVVKDLKRSGVKVIGRKGDLRDVEGHAVKSGRLGQGQGQGREGGGGAGGYKL